MALIASIALSVTSFLISYGKRRAKNIVAGTLGFAIAVFSVHFIAMAGTGFVLSDGAAVTGGRLSNELLAFGVTVSVFVLSGAFLLSGATFTTVKDEPIAPQDKSPEEPLPATRIPYEANAQTYFLDPAQVSAIRAEGHYTVLYVGDQKLFCPWSITEAETRIAGSGFIRTHRSYLVNTAHVTSFERKKDNGVCYFAETNSLTKAPVSRSRLPILRDILGM